MNVHDEETELEIAAFMGPHIQRARIVLFAIGALYLIATYLTYNQVSQLRALEDVRLQHLADIALYVTIGYGVAGFATLVLAGIAGTKTTFAIYGATGIFAANLLLNIWANGIAWLIDPGAIVFWLILIALGMGVQAAWKANKLRRERQPARATLLAA